MNEKNYESDITLNMRRLYKSMKRIRMVEEFIADNYSKGEMRCPTHLSIGQEAVPSALSLCLSKEDIAVSTHRCHAHYLAKGGSLKAMIAEIYGKETGCCKGKGGSMHLIDMEAGFAGSSAIVGNSIPIGTGIALSMKLNKHNNISVIYFGDGATEEGSFYESLNFATVKELNALYICENNLYSVYSPLSVRQASNRSLLKIAEGIGVKRTYSMDGNDAIKSYQAVRNIVEEMRTEAGPTVIEFTTYRWREHCGPNFDNEIGYRDVKEFEEWKKQDPIANLRKRLQSEIRDFTEWESKIISDISAEIKDAFNYAEQSPYPDMSSVTEHIFATS